MWCAVLWLPPPRRICFHRCLSVCLFVCLLLATLRKKFQTDLHEIFREGWQWANEQMIKFWWQSRSGIWIRIRIWIWIWIRIVTLVTHALVEVCTVVTPFPSNRHHRSSGDCLKGKGENYQVCSVQYCVQQLCTVRCTHIWTDWQFSGLGSFSMGPFHCA